ncbi:MAG TPA: formate dehydrogenase accessory sulfurtransferase FdhD [Candidatus Acidoferrales bacterium]|nr:formate dehydrogenase accessory sulfurtransferase FdhD [Candidatus Acidoferrales bacterium]
MPGGLASGGGFFEAASAAAPLLASVSAPSSLAMQLAREMGITLVGFLRGRRFVVYAGEERLSRMLAAR